MTSSSNPKIQVKQFTESYFGRGNIYFQIVVLDKQIVCWVGGEEAKFASLGSAVRTRYSNAAAGTTLLSTGVDDASENVAKRLACKYDWQFFVSMNLPSNDVDMMVFGERMLGKHVKLITEEHANANATS